VRRVVANLRYLRALALRFRITLGSAVALFGGIPWLYVLLYVGPSGEHLGFGEAFNHVYFLLFGQPTLPYVPNLAIEVLNITIPPFGVAVVVEGAVRLAVLVWAREHQDKEWVTIMTQSYSNHVVVCGAGRTGYRVALLIRDLGRDVVAIEKKEDGPFVAILRDAGIHVLIDDIRTKSALERTNVRGASSIVCATDNDLANLNAAMDARRLNPGIHVVMRMFDDDLAATVRDAIKAETMSTTAVAAPAMALAALDPRVDHSFRVGKHLMVVSEFVAATILATLSVGDLRDKFGGLVLGMTGGDGRERLHPPDVTPICRGDKLIVQAEWTDYLALRKHLGEERPAAS
jgi:voltage-gated potassium channel